MTETVIELALDTFGNSTQIGPIIYLFHVAKGKHICCQCHAHYCRKHRQCEQALRLTPERHSQNQYRISLEIEENCSSAFNE